MEPDSLQKVFDSTFTDISQVREAFKPQLTPHEVGTITSVATGIAKVSGLPGVGFDELVTFPGDVLGIAFNVDKDEIGVVLLGEYWHLHAGDEVRRTGRVMDVAVGDELLGRVIDPLCRPLDGNGPVPESRRMPIELPAAAIMDRAPVSVPLQTGIKVIDALIPVGRGQRELILGDRQTGKTAIAIDTILNQRGQNVLCVYCAIGQRASAVAKAVATLKEKGAMDYTVVVVAEGNDPPGLAYIAPYAATSIAEYFMKAGKDVLIVYDDLTHHARAYRELSLLLRRPPGREAFPGDIFYIHSRLLERATHLSKELGGGSLTALPIIETEAQDISAYIPTNLISITDGQIYLSPTLFELGVLPAVDVAKSVSRVGGKAQRAAYRAVAGDLKLAYAQFEELETFSKFGARLDEETNKIIEHGRRIRACLKQPEFSPVPVPGQIAVLLALTAELFDHVPLEKMTDAENSLHQAAEKLPKELSDRLLTSDKLSEEDRKAIIEIARQALEKFQPKPASSAGEPAVKPEVKAESKTKAKNEPQPETKNESKVETKSESKPEVETKTEAKVESKTEPKAETKSEIKPETKTEPKPASSAGKPEVKEEPKPETKTAVQPEATAEPKPEQEKP
jgi:F-type H+-transporting ATPase subunit alpha